ncbi:sulfatase [Thalassoroseus pseudoceratinae]|uniref:sulfatase n=1 Tax=Thalassoroseus pseudoceratinae TaxID=2713176 RepID=UPI0014205C15|nr:sulfatase [Thalassoroseus pseudoceratinae]
MRHLHNRWWRESRNRFRCAFATCVRAAVTSLFLTVFVSTVAAAEKQSHPNIVLILADDLAWADLACYGHPWHDTPNLDRLADQGMKFTNGYAAAPICSASRASLLTGKTTARLGFEFVTKNKPGHQQLDADTPLVAPPFTLNLPLDEITIAETLQQSGYATAFFGKWHLNAHYQRYLGWSPTHGPRQQGFQFAIEDFGGHPYSWGRTTPEPLTKKGQFPKDTLVESTCKYLRQSQKKPFFAMVSHFYVHTPVKTPCRWLIEKYERLIPADSPARERRLRYAAFVETLDHYVGRILNAIDETATRDNTLVVFTSDNGGHPEYTANGPLRGSKWNLYEGGIRVPLLVRWPNHVLARSTTDEPAIGYDLHATFAEAAGVPPSQTDGISLLPLLTKQQAIPNRALIWHFPYYHPERGFAKAPDRIGVDDFVTSRTRPHSAMRLGAYKVIRYYEDESTELYDLSHDPAEHLNLRSQNPQMATQLTQQLKRTLADMNARLPSSRPNTR